jgi:hypothetical protein
LILFYGFETWSLIIREEHVLRVLGQGAAGNMREEVTRLEKIRIEELIQLTLMPVFN